MWLKWQTCEIGFSRGCFNEFFINKSFPSPLSGPMPNNRGAHRWSFEIPTRLHFFFYDFGTEFMGILRVSFITRRFYGPAYGWCWFEKSYSVCLKSRRLGATSSRNSASRRRQYATTILHSFDFPSFRSLTKETSFFPSYMRVIPQLRPSWPRRWYACVCLRVTSRCLHRSHAQTNRSRGDARHFRSWPLPGVLLPPLTRLKPLTLQRAHCRPVGLGGDVTRKRARPGLHKHHSAKSVAVLAHACWSFVYFRMPFKWGMTVGFFIVRDCPMGVVINNFTVPSSLCIYFKSDSCF